MTSAVMATEIPGLPAPRRGKVRDVYDLGDEVLIVASDRVSAFDVIMANGIPDKGRILTQLSTFWFERLRHMCNHHLVSTDDAEIAERVGSHEALKGRSVIARKARPLRIECVARGYITGSLYKQYLNEGGRILGLDLPDGLQNGSPLPEPIFTPATKAEEGHDENITFDQAVEIEGADVASQVRELTLRLYRLAAAHAAAQGLILADTKFEFGLTDDGLIWIDEALTPDSSRYWEADAWAPGVALPGFDKQFVRDYLETINWDKQPPGPELPGDVIQGTRERYLTAFRRLTGSEPAL